MEKQIAGSLELAQLKQKEVDDFVQERKDLQEAMEPVFELLAAGSENLSFLERVRQVPEQIGEFCKATLKDCTNKVLALFKAHNPAAKLELKYLPAGTTEEQYEALVTETELMAEEFVNSLQQC